jgi:hypothetical protein
MSKPVLASLLLIALGAAPAGAASYLLNGNGVGTSYSTGWTLAGNDLYLRDDYAYTQAIDALATATPSAAGVGFAPGNYDVYVQWDAYSLTPPATDAARYTVNHTGGSAQVTINQRQYASQGASTGAPFLDDRGGGLYYLGNFNLNNASTMSVQKANGEATTYLTHDAFYLTNDGVIVDDLSEKVTYTGYGASTIFHYPGQPEIDLTSSYPYAQVAGATATYSPGLTGLREVFISWSAATHHTASVLAVFDGDGDFGTLGDQVALPAINTLLLANGTAAGGTQTWSQLESLGEFDLQPGSAFRFTNNTGSPMALDVMWVSNVIPEPASAGLVVVGAGILALRRRRV